MDAVTSFELGSAAYSEMELGLAEGCFRRVLEVNPGNHRARLELGRVLFQVGNLTESELAFRAVLEQPVPPMVEQNINGYLDRIAAVRQAPYQPAGSLKVMEQAGANRRLVIKTQISAGVTHDTNVNYGPKGNSVRVQPFTVGSTSFDQLEVSAGSKPQDSLGGFGYINVGVSQQLDDKERRSLLYGVEYFQNWLEEASEYELRNVAGIVGLRLVGVNSYVELPIKYSVVQLDGKGFLDQIVFNPGYYLMVSKDLNVSTRFQYRLKDYKDADRLDGASYTIEQHVSRNLGSRINRVGAGIALFYDDAEDKIYENTGWSAELSGQYELAMGMVGNGLLGVRRADYEGREVLAPEDRSDTEYTAGLGVYRLFWGDWIGALNYQYITTDSTFDIYTYEREVLTLSTAREF
jgi:tetratricopeptide (TPR) repeat protein